jgi:hypothetical protein
MTVENNKGVKQNPTEKELLGYIPRNSRGIYEINGTEFARFFIPIDDSWRDPINQGTRERQFSNPNINFLSQSKPEVIKYMNMVKQVANDQNKNPENLRDVFEYCEPLGKVYKLLAQEALEKVGDSAIVYAPDNGGKYVKWILEQVLKDKKVNWQLFQYRMSRQQVDCGPYGKRLGVGTIFYDYLVMMRSFRNQVLFDDCIATNVSLEGTYQIIEDELGEGIHNCNFNIFTSVANVSTLDGLASDISRRGVKNIHATSGIPNYRLNEHGYLMEENGDYTVSDMGLWTKDFMEISEQLKKALF